MDERSRSGFHPALHESIFRYYADESLRLRKELDEVAECLPSVYYMDPPDGGTVSPEQVRRMAEDAAHHRNAAQPSPTGQDVREQFEAWAGEAGYGLQVLPSGDYYNTTTICAWFGWQAALAAHQPVGQEPEPDVYLVQAVKDGEAWEHRWYVPRWGDPVPTALDGAVYEIRGRKHPELGTYRVKPFYAAPPAQTVDLGDFRTLYQAKCPLESGRDRINGLGGSCDPVDVMEANDLGLQAARRVIASKAVRNA